MQHSVGTVEEWDEDWGKDEASEELKSFWLEAWNTELATDKCKATNTNTGFIILNDTPVDQGGLSCKILQMEVILQDLVRWRLSCKILQDGCYLARFLQDLAR